MVFKDIDSRIHDAAITAGDCAGRRVFPSYFSLANLAAGVFSSPSNVVMRAHR
jgi:hypothetical protein